MRKCEITEKELAKIVEDAMHVGEVTSVEEREDCARDWAARYMRLRGIES